MKKLLIFGIIVLIVLAYLWIGKTHTPLVQLDDSVMTGEVLTGDVGTGVEMQ